MKTNFFKIDKENMIFTGKYMEAYIPTNVYKLADEHGENVNLMGIFNFRIGKARGEIDPKSYLYTFNFPTTICSTPSQILKGKIMEILPGKGEKEYVVLQYYENSVIMKTEMVQDITNVKNFLDLLLNGGMPNTIKVSDVLRGFYKNLELNNETANVSGVILSAIVSELYRYSKDQTIPIRKKIGKKECTELDYVLNNARQVCANNNTFAALTFEDVDTMLVYSINRFRHHKKENETPLEEIIKQ